MGELNVMEFRDRAARYHRAIKSILLHEWDPIGVADVPEARDEYDSYVPGIYKMLISRRDEKDIFDYLWEIETEHMGLFGNRGHTEAISKKLARLRERIDGGEEI